MFRSACLATFLGLALSEQPVAEDVQDTEVEETCALQVQAKTGKTNCGGHYASSCLHCDQGHGASWCNGECAWDYSSNTCKEAGAPTPAPTPPTPAPPLCALCETCGGTFPESGGRITYFRDEPTEFSSYGEECSGQERTRQPDGNVIFSPRLCCTPAYGPYGSLAQAAQKEQTSEQAKQEHAKEQAKEDVTVKSHEHEVRALSAVETSSNASTAMSSNGWCLLCDECGNGFDHNVGEITSLKYPPANSDRNSQNYERHEGVCRNTGGTRGAPPAAKVCCKRPPINSFSAGACAVCQGSCGSSYPSDGGKLSYTTNGDVVSFRGYGSGCQDVHTLRSSSNANDAPHLCCAR